MQLPRYQVVQYCTGNKDIVVGSDLGIQKGDCIGELQWVFFMTGNFPINTSLYNTKFLYNTKYNGKHMTLNIYQNPSNTTVLKKKP